MKCTGMSHLSLIPQGPLGSCFLLCVFLFLLFCFFLPLSLWSGDLLFLCGFVAVFSTLPMPFPPSVHSSPSSSLFLLLSFCVCSSHPSLPPSLPPWVTDPRSPSPCLPLSGSIYVQLFLPHLLSCPVTSLPVCEPVCLSFSVCVNTFVFILLSFSVCVDTLLCSRSRPRQRFQMLWNVCQSCHFMYH